MERTFFDYFKFCLKKWYIILVLGVLVAVIGFGFTYYSDIISSRQFDTILRVEVLSVNESNMVNSYPTGVSYVETFLTTPTHLEKVIDSVDISKCSLSKDRLLKLLSDKNNLSFETNGNAVLGYVTITFKPNCSQDVMSDEFVFELLDSLNAEIISFVASTFFIYTYTCTVEKAPVSHLTEKSLVSDIILPILLYFVVGMLIAIMGILIYFAGDKRLRLENVENIMEVNILGKIEGKELKDDKRYN